MSFNNPKEEVNKWINKIKSKQPAECMAEGIYSFKPKDRFVKRTIADKELSQIFDGFNSKYIKLYVWVVK